MPETQDVYPLGETTAESLTARSGRRLSELTLAGVRAGDVGPDDFAISAETLRRQAALAETHGYGKLAANLRRAAELTAVPDDELLAIYNALRPRRTTYAGLIDLAGRMEATYGAVETARFIREAADAYRAVGLT
jgi:propanediol dehydratase small subunit